MERGGEVGDHFLLGRLVLDYGRVVGKEDGMDLCGRQRVGPGGARAQELRKGPRKGEGSHCIVMLGRGACGNELQNARLANHFRRRVVGRVHDQEGVRTSLFQNLLDPIPSDCRRLIGVLGAMFHTPG